MSGARPVDLVRRVRAAFLDRPDPRLAVLDGWDAPERPAAALLAATLGQDLTIAGTARILREAREELGPLALRAGAGDWDALERFARRPWLRDWAHRDSLAGWILAASDFQRVHGDPARWTERFDPPGLVRTLAAELPWMGARSAHRVKAWRLARWLGRGELGGGIEDGFRRLLKVPHRAVERPLSALSALPTGWDGWERPRRQSWVDAVCGEAFPDDPASAWPALETVLARGRGGPACQDHLGGCGACPVRPSCPSPARSFSPASS